MPLFKCDKCGVVENTALSPKCWINHIKNEPVLCSKCSTGKWHGRFAKSKTMPSGEVDIFKTNKNN